MRDWKAIAAGIGPDIPPEARDRAVASQERVDGAFRPLVRKIPLVAEPAFVSLRFPEDQE